MTESRKSAVRPGRPRDGDIDRRVMEAAVDLYARLGWAGFNFESVARAAGVGKPALYRRWDSREDMLGAAMASISRPYRAEDVGTVRDGLLDWATMMFDWWSGIGGAAFARMHIDQRYHPELSTQYFTMVKQPHAAAARGIVTAGVARGELPADVDVNLLLDIINGAIFSRIINTRPEDREKLAARSQAILAQLVDAALAGARVTVS